MYMCFHSCSVSDALRQQKKRDVRGFGSTFALGEEEAVLGLPRSILFECTGSTAWSWLVSLALLYFIGRDVPEHTTESLSHDVLQIVTDAVLGNTAVELVRVDTSLLDIVVKQLLVEDCWILFGGRGSHL